MLCDKAGCFRCSNCTVFQRHSQGLASPGVLYILTNIYPFRTNRYVAYTDFCFHLCSAFSRGMDLSDRLAKELQQGLLLPLLLGPASTCIPSVCGSSTRAVRSSIPETQAASSAHSTTIPRWSHMFARCWSADPATGDLQVPMI